MSDGGGLSLENTCHGVGLIGCLSSFAKSVLGVDIDLFLLLALLTWVLAFCWRLKVVSGLERVGLTLLHFLLFIVVSRGTPGGYSFPFDLHVNRMSIIGHTVRNNNCKGSI